MIELYAKEDYRFGVVLQDGIIVNTDRPLFPQISYLKQKYGQPADSVPNQQLTVNYEEDGKSEIE